MNHWQVVAMQLLAQATTDAAEISEATEAQVAWYQQPPVAFGIIIATCVVCFLISKAYARSIRMSEMGWRIALMLSCLVVSLEVVVFKWPPRLGVDLKGGVVYMAKIDKAAEDEDVRPEDLVPRLKERVDPSNTKEIMIRPFGNEMIEIVIPDVTEAEGDRIWNTLTRAGFMQFRIVSESGNDPDLFRAATEAASLGRTSPWVESVDGRRIGKWVGIGRKRSETGDVGPYRYVPSSANLLRSRESGQIVTPPVGVYSDLEGVAFTEWADDAGIEVQILVKLDNYNVTGDYIVNPAQGFDERGRNAVNFQLQGDGIGFFYKLTDSNTNRPLGIVMDDKLLSAPNINTAISTNGQIMGDFTSEEVEDLVNILKSGRLPATINEQWESKDQVDSNIGEQMKKQGLAAIGLSFLAVMVFMLIYYRFSGVVACFALLLNVSMIVGLTMLISFPFSLTSLAGLVLTVGMSVDANVLIYERIREELVKGTALRMAIRNGFARATTTIVDANVTTLITAIVLYVIGTEQIRGFAVTLILGIVISMFTAIFCARVIFEIAERKRMVTRLQMMQILSVVKINFSSYWKVSALVSVLVIAGGLAAVFYRGSGILSHDLSGGSSARVVLASPAGSDDEVRDALMDRFAGTGSFSDLGPVEFDGVEFTVEVSPVKGADGYKDGMIYRVDTSLKPWDSDLGAVPEGYPVFTRVLEQALGDQLAHYEVSIGELVLTPVANQGDSSEATPETGTGDIDVPADPGATQPEDSGLGEEATETESTETESTEQEGGGEQSRVSQPVVQYVGYQEEDTDSGTEEENTVEGDVANVSLVDARADLQFRYPIDEDGLREAIRAVVARKSLGVSADVVELNSIDADSETGSGWQLSVASADEADMRTLLAELKADFEQTPYFRSMADVGGQVAVGAQVQATVAMLASLIGIVLYLWIRFQRVVFGLAAVVALVHDVLVVLGAIAISYWLSGGLGFLMVDNFKISLPVIAAFLTIIGYSLNDTIVVFDRIRETKGKNPKLTADMINTSISQTLSRTILTSLTTFLVVSILYFLGGDAIHAFAFSLVIGVLVGTYSSIFIASPVLYWLATRTNEA